MHVSAQAHPVCDECPERDLFRSVDTPPAPHSLVEVLFADGRTSVQATFSEGGNVHPSIWWGWCPLQRRFCEIHPIGWRFIDRSSALRLEWGARR
jgi:hypothetical protein